jgi:hypothetical protein
MLYCRLATSARIWRVGRGHRFAGEDDGEPSEDGHYGGAALLDHAPQFAQLLCVLAGEFVVGENRSSAGFQDAHDLLDGLPASCAVADVVQAEIGDDKIETRVSKRHLLRRRAYERAELRDAFELEVVLRGCGGVSSHIGVRPDINPRGMAAAVQLGDPLCCTSKQQAATAAHVEYAFIAAPRMHLEHEIAVAQLAELHIEKQEQPFADEKAGRPEKGARPEGQRTDANNDPRRECGEQQACEADEEEGPHDNRAVYTIVGFCRYRAHKDGIIAPTGNIGEQIFIVRTAIAVSRGELRPFLWTAFGPTSKPFLLRSACA